MPPSSHHRPLPRPTEPRGGPPDWAVDLVDLLALRRGVTFAVAVGVSGVALAVAAASPQLLPPRPLAGAAVGLAAYLLAVAAAVAVDAGDRRIRGRRHVRAVGGTVAAVSGVHPSPTLVDWVDERSRSVPGFRLALAACGGEELGAGRLAEELAAALAQAGRRVLLAGLSRPDHARPGVVEVCRGQTRLSEAASFHPQLDVARVGAGRDLGEALAGFPAVANRLPRDVDVLVAALPGLQHLRVLPAVAACDHVLVLARIGVTTRVELIAGLDAIDELTVPADVVLLRDDGVTDDVLPPPAQPAPAGDEAEAVDDGHATDGADTPREADAGDEAHAGDQADAADEAHAGDQGKAGDEAQAGDEAHAAEEVDAGDEPHAGDEVDGAHAPRADAAPAEGWEPGDILDIGDTPAPGDTPRTSGGSGGRGAGTPEPRGDTPDSHHTVEPDGDTVVAGGDTVVADDTVPEEDDTVEIAVTGPGSVATSPAPADAVDHPVGTVELADSEQPAASVWQADIDERAASIQPSRTDERAASVQPSRTDEPAASVQPPDIDEPQGVRAPGSAPEPPAARASGSARTPHGQATEPARARGPVPPEVAADANDTEAPLRLAVTLGALAEEAGARDEADDRR